MSGVKLAVSVNVDREFPDWLRVSCWGVGQTRGGVVGMLLLVPVFIVNAGLVTFILRQACDANFANIGVNDGTTANIVSRAGEEREGGGIA